MCACILLLLYHRMRQVSPLAVAKSHFSSLAPNKSAAAWGKKFLVYIDIQPRRRAIATLSVCAGTHEQWGESQRPVVRCKNSNTNTPIVIKSGLNLKTPGCGNELATVEEETI